MSINATIIKAVTPIVSVCVPGIYRPDAGTEAPSVWCTFTCTEVPDSFGDGAPEAIRYLGQLHLYLPDGQSPITLKRRLRRALLVEDFATGAWEDASDLDGQHYVLEFEAADGEV